MNTESQQQLYKPKRLPAAQTENRLKDNQDFFHP